MSTATGDFHRRHACSPLSKVPSGLFPLNCVRLSFTRIQSGSCSPFTLAKEVCECLNFVIVPLEAHILLVWPAWPPLRTGNMRCSLSEIDFAASNDVVVDGFTMCDKGTCSNGGSFSFNVVVVRAWGEGVEIIGGRGFAMRLPNGSVMSSRG